MFFLLATVALNKRKLQSTGLQFQNNIQQHPMKHSSSTQHLQRFVYVDSSEEQEASPPTSQPRSPKISRQCRWQGPNLLDPSFNAHLKEIVRQQVDRIQHGQNLLIPVGESQMEEALLRRQQNYKWFLKEMEIDKKYKQIIGGKVSKLKQKNQKKEHILAKKRLEEKYRAEEDKLKKLLISKEDKQQKALSNLHKMTHKLGIERNAMISKRLRSAVQSERQKTSHQLADLQQKQKAQLDELRNKYKEIKQSERLNKIQQEKVLRDLQSKNKELKKDVQQKLKTKKEFAI